MSQFIASGSGGRILFLCNVKDVDGVPALTPMPRDGRVYHPWPDPFPLTPPTPTKVAFFLNGRPQWIEMGTLDQQRAALADAISAACRAQIEQGFMCAALGAPFLYPAKQQDQDNLNGSVTDSLLFTDDPEWVTPFWCRDEAGAWEFRPHTRAQIQQVGRVGKTSILAAMQKNENLQRQIASANAEQLPAITW